MDSLLLIKTKLLRNTNDIVLLNLIMHNNYYFKTILNKKK